TGQVLANARRAVLFTARLGRPAVDGSSIRFPRPIHRSGDDALARLHEVGQDARADRSRSRSRRARRRQRHADLHDRQQADCRRPAARGVSQGDRLRHGKKSAAVNSLLRIPYAFAGLVTEAFVQATPAGQSKFRRGLSARRGITERYARWAAAARDSSKPLVWFHAPSVGEGLQALPVINLLRERQPNVQIAYTYYSPSAEQFARSVKADF